MERYEEAEKLVAQVTGGKLVPGSGCGKRKGDVTYQNYAFEVKQTDKDVLSIQKHWLDKLEREHPFQECVLVIFFGLVGFPYYRVRRVHDKYSPWKTLNVTYGNLPNYIYNNSSTIWELDTWDSLANL